ncbi:MAG: ISAzo13 family transposase [Anaerolineales bacterium]|nr:ISAzo13 family transposase [Anaerolineales bacterium]
MSDTVEKIKVKYEHLRSHMDEKVLRLWAAVEAQSLGRGGITQVAAATLLSRTTIYVGMSELESGGPGVESRLPGRIRRTGGGRKKLKEKDPSLLQDLDELLEPATRGDPETPLRWTCKSTTKLAEELTARGHPISQRTVCDLLDELGYSLQGNRKTKEGSSHPDRDQQFVHISEKVKELQSIGQPVISVDTKKKEMIGEFKNGGQEWEKKGKPVEVNVYDFPDPILGKAIPYGVYDITANKGWVNVGIDHDTSEFAVESIRRWWREMGSPLYPDAKELLITADGGGSNGSRVRLWKLELQNLADELGMDINVCHFPPGTSKWNKIEHKMFSFISQNWRGRPLITREVVVNLISNTRTKKGLEITAKLDINSYKTGIKVSDQELQKIAIEKDDFHGEWNYKIKPRSLH